MTRKHGPIGIRPLISLLKCLPVIMAGFGGFSAYADEDAPEPSNRDVSNSLEIVLQKASEQGFVELAKPVPDLHAVPEQHPDPEQHEDTVHREEAKHQQNSVVPEIKTVVNQLSCQHSHIFDLKDNMQMDAYADIAKTKAGLTSFDTLEGRLPLIKTYWSLGLGTEAVALAQPIQDSRTPLVQAIGKTISGDVQDRDIAALRAVENCGALPQFWSSLAQIEPSVPSQFDVKILDTLPSKLREILTIRLGTQAAEVGDLTTAIQLLTSLNPEGEPGDLPLNRDDETLYLFALIDMGQSGTKGKKIIERLGMFDGPVRTNALRTLSEKNLHEGEKLYSGFSDDLKAVSHQFQGKSASREASVQAISILLKSGAFTESVMRAEKDLDADSEERQQAVGRIGEHVMTGLQTDQYAIRFEALGAYLFDVSFFEPFEKLPALKLSALHAAVELNLPELGDEIIDRDHETALDRDQKKLLAYARLQAADKFDDLKAIKTQAAAYPAEKEFQAIRLSALTRLGGKKETLTALQNLPIGPDRFSRQADIEWRDGNFAAATSALQALNYTLKDEDVKQELDLSAYLTFSPRTYSEILIPDTAKELDELEANISKDIGLVKAYLEDG